MNDDKPDSWHFKSLELAATREALGGVKAAESFMAYAAVEALLLRGWTVESIQSALSTVDASRGHHG